MKTRTAQGFTLIELLIVVAIIGIIAAVAVPGLLRARMSGNEASAIGTMRAIASAQATFSSTAAHSLGYADQLTRLGIYCPSDLVPFLAPDLTAGVTVQKSGFTITMAAASGVGAGPTDCNGAVSVRGYYATATASNPGISGGRAFAVGTNGAVWENNSMPGSTAPTEVEMAGAPTAAVHPLR